ncbi:RrF2 family transcriptional regulator [Agrobacterium pusense]|uniref:RrF2 family transcriptional regulator n=1 Tax=Agrobacterium pusense TaxID=648995 RepID=UPI0005ED6337|nr:Rrf2 family transcriptional regulator [Agrobacterium pusense]OAI82992.1 Rrf2 family transcriptional regulator [Rhizobium sp. GHKF11]
MKLSEGVEQAIHCTAFLAGLSENGVLSAAALAELHGVSTSYLLKHLQALSGAGIVATTPGPRGGYRLAKAPNDISLLDIVLAVEGPAPAFRCAEIRQRGPNPLPQRYFTKPCQINAVMLKAEKAYRAELAKVSVADLLADLGAADDGGIAARGCAFLELHERKTGNRASS